MYLEKLTVKKLKQILEKYKVPDNALICCGSDEELNRITVCDDVYIDRIGRKESECVDGKWYDYISGEDVIGFDPEDKDRIFITFHPMY